MHQVHPGVPEVHMDDMGGREVGGVPAGNRSVTDGRHAPSMGEYVLLQQSEMLEREWQRMLAEERAKGSLPTSATGIVLDHFCAGTRFSSHYA